MRKNIHITQQRRHIKYNYSLSERFGEYHINHRKIKHLYIHIFLKTYHF